MWPFRSKKAKPSLGTLVFSSPEDFFEYQCKFGVADIVENKGLIALVEFGAEQANDPRKADSASPQTVGLRVVSRDGGFRVFAQPLSDGPLLWAGDCAVWVPMEYNEALSKLTGDPRSGWVGFVAATVAPKIDPSAPSFEILNRYDGT